MKDLARLVAAALVLAIVAPVAIFSIRLAQTWTIENTQQLLGGGLAVCGGGIMLLACFIGAGAFAKLAGWRPPRQEAPLPPIDILPRELPPSIPPWGLTGGGQYEVLPPPGQDRRYSMTVPKKGGDSSS